MNYGIRRQQIGYYSCSSSSSSSSSKSSFRPLQIVRIFDRISIVRVTETFEYVFFVCIHSASPRMGVSRITTVVFRADVTSYSQTLYWARKRRVQSFPAKSVRNQKYPTRQTENNAPIIAMKRQIGYQAGRRIGYQG